MVWPCGTCSGGLELLFGNQKEVEVDVPTSSGDTVRQALPLLSPACHRPGLVLWSMGTGACAAGCLCCKVPSTYTSQLH